MNDYMLELSKENIPGHSSINKFGRNSNVASGATEEIWDGSAVYTWPSTASITHIRSAVDSSPERVTTVARDKSIDPAATTPCARNAVKISAMNERLLIGLFVRGSIIVAMSHSFRVRVSWKRRFRMHQSGRSHSGHE